MRRRVFVASTAVAAASTWSAAVLAQKRVMQGVSDNEIRIGSTGPLSGPAAAWSLMNKAIGVYFDMVNAGGGINGRKINFLLADDGFSPPKTVDQVRKLVERDDVAFMAGQVGTSTSVASRGYLNDAGVPQLFVISGSDMWINDLDKFPRTRGFTPVYSDEGRAIGAHLLATKPGAKLAILYQNDDSARDFVHGLKESLGRAGASLIAKEETYEGTDPTVDSQVISLQGSGAGTLVFFGNPKAAAQAIRKSADSGWKPQLYLSQGVSSVEQVLKPAGLDKAKGAYSSQFLKDPNDPVWASDPGVVQFNQIMDKYGKGLAHDTLAALGFSIGKTIAQLVQQCGADLSRENLVKQTMALDLDLPLLLPGLRLKTSAANRHPLRALRMAQFDGSTWKLVATK
jgi:ABC-type branched-subunit amino acid transport system substrate-binding protein